VVIEGDFIVPSPPEETLVTLYAGFTMCPKCWYIAPVSSPHAVQIYGWSELRKMALKAFWHEEKKLFKSRKSFLDFIRKSLKNIWQTVASIVAFYRKEYMIGMRYVLHCPKCNFTRSFFDKDFALHASRIRMDIVNDKILLTVSGELYTYSVLANGEVPRKALEEFREYINELLTSKHFEDITDDDIEAFNLYRTI